MNFLIFICIAGLYSTAFIIDLKVKVIYRTVRNFAENIKNWNLRVIYPDNFEQKIGFDQIREILTKGCLSKLGREKVSQMRFMTEKLAICSEIDRTAEFKEICLVEDSFPQDNYIDLSDCLKRVRIKGTHIMQAELFDLRKSLSTIVSILNFFGNKDDESAYPALRAMAGDIVNHAQIVRSIDRIMDNLGNIKDSASPELAQIRSSISAKKSSVSRVMQSKLKQAQKEGWTDSGTELAVRSGRTVIAVESVHKRKLKGVILDESSTGKTAYIEPIEVFEINNEINELEFEERREIVKILTLFTDELRDDIPDLLLSYDFLGEIDFLRAKARFAINVDAQKPHISDVPKLQIEQGKHPLLMLSLRKKKQEVIPLRAVMRNDQRILVISGPNAGGKSVCLKTVVMLQYMFQSGLLVTAADFSDFGIFKNIFIDIGDEQSMDNDLSTYSSHLLNMKNFLRRADKHSIFFIDEFGTGTEPLLGGAIAESVLTKLNETGAFGVITTHYTNLKHLAESTKGLVNGAMLFDSINMEPLYKLRIGTPGSSFAFEIAKNMGLPANVLQLAEEKLGTDVVNFDKNLKDLEREKQFLFKKRKEIKERDERLSQLIEKYESQLTRVNAQKKDIIKEANEKAGKLLADANSKIENTIREIKENQAEKQKTRKLRAELESFKLAQEKDVQEEQERINRKIEKIKNRQNKRDNRKKNTEAEASPQPKKSKLIAVGDKVKMKGQTAAGEVLALNGKKAIVSFGLIKTTVAVDRLEHTTQSEYDKNQKTVRSQFSLSDNYTKRRLNFKPELDIRGQRADDAMAEVHDYVENAIVLGIHQIQILHGKGNGILRKLLREYLHTVDMVSGFSDAHEDFGGAGITVIEIKS